MDNQIKINFGGRILEEPENTRGLKNMTTQMMI